jgi:hypothetical protein
VITPYPGRDKSASQKAANRAHARLPGERASAQLKTWRILRKLRCCPWRAGHLAKAIHVLASFVSFGIWPLFRDGYGCRRWLGPGGEQDALAEQRESGSPEHLAFDHLVSYLESGWAA